MDDFVIILDICSDANKELREKYNLDYIPGHITLPTGEDVVSYLDWSFISRDTFYSQLKSKKMTFTTSPPSTQETFNMFKEYLEKGKDIIYISISNSLSGSFTFAQLAKKQLDGIYKDRKIEIVDSLRYSSAITLLGIYGSIYRSEGHSFSETVKYLNTIKHRIHQMGPMDDLFYLSRKGRITNAKAFFGTFIGIKPLGDFDKDGRTSVIAKAVGIKSAINITVNYIKKSIVDSENQILFISHTNRLDNANLLKARIEKEIKCKEIILNECYPNSAINIGPGLATCFFLGEEVSDNLEKEKKIMQEVIDIEK